MIAVLQQFVDVGGDIAATFGRLSSSFIETTIYAAGSLLLAGVIAIPLAWLCTHCRFRGARFFSVALAMPLAIPLYLTGYIYADIFYALGISRYELPAAILITALALYPYLFIICTGVFGVQSKYLMQVARIEGCSKRWAFAKVTLPLARPAIVIGSVLIVMEIFNDIALAEEFGLNTLSLALFNHWMEQADMRSTFLIAIILLALAVVFLSLEEISRRQQRYYTPAAERHYGDDAIWTLSGRQQRLTLAGCGIVFGLGYLLPVGWLLKLSVRHYHHVDGQQLFVAVAQTGALIIAAIGLLCACALVLNYDRRLHRHHARRPVTRGIMSLLYKIAQTGYALPGIVVAIGVLLIGKWISEAGIPLNPATLVALMIFAYGVRFMVISFGCIEHGLEKITPTTDTIARLSGARGFSLLRKVHLPMLRPAIFSCIVLLALEIIKDLPIVLMLRPFDFNTLALYVYQYASDESLELAAPYGLCIALAGGALLAVLLGFGQKNR